MTPVINPPLVACSPSSGHNRFFGTTKFAGATDAVAPNCVFQAMTTRVPSRALHVGMSGATGNWELAGIRAREAEHGYTIIAYDPTGQYDPACKTNLIPSPMPPDPDEH